MSKHNNVKPDHFKTAGREPQGRDVVHDVQRQLFAETKVRERRNDPKTARAGLTAPPSEKIAGRQGASRKKGKRSSAPKMESTRRNFKKIPAATKPAGASGGGKK